jgi:membrane associated rhomboid family serine protease
MGHSTLTKYANLCEQNQAYIFLTSKIRPPMSLLILLIVSIVVVSLIAFVRPDVKHALLLKPYNTYRGHELHGLITSAFIHADFWHLAINMYVLWGFGGLVDQRFALINLRFLQSVPSIHTILLFFIGVVGANLITTQLNHGDKGYASLGASGGVSAVVFARIALRPLQSIYLFGALPIPGIILGIGYLIYSYIASKRKGDNINHIAHFAGAVLGFAYPFLASSNTWHLFSNEITSWL